MNVIGHTLRSARPHLILWCALILLSFGAVASEPSATDTSMLPRAVADYDDSPLAPLSEVLTGRIARDPFNLVAALLFAAAITHTFLAGHLRKIGDYYDRRYSLKIQRLQHNGKLGNYFDSPRMVSFKGKLFHFLGEVEAIFGIWCIPLLLSMFYFYDWRTVTDYMERRVNYTEPMFVVVIMAIASTRPVVRFSEICLEKLANMGRTSVSAWWLTLLIVCPLLGSLITEPAAMTIGALLLAKKFYHHHPSPHLAYATIGLLFVNVSVGGTLTHFAAPPVLMVAGKWNWDTAYMISHFGWKAFVGIVLSTTGYWIVFRKELDKLGSQSHAHDGGNPHGAVSYWADRKIPVPAWITMTHILFLLWTVATLHHPVFFLAGFLFFLAFVESTMTHQNPVQLRSPLMVGFFLAGLVTFGSLQQWWLEPVLRGLGEFPLFLGAAILTSFNDNAAITYLASQVPTLGAPSGESLRYMVVAGAVTGGGLTVIANAPNPAGQSILQKHFENGVSPLWLLLWAIPPTLVQAICFLILN